MPYLYYYELFYIVIIVVIIIGKSYSHEEKGVKNYVRVDNKYFNPLKQQSIISHLSYQCYKNISIKINLLSERFVSVNISCKKNNNI